MNKYILYTRIQMCVGGGGNLGKGPQTDKHLPQSPLTCQYFLMTAFCIAFYEPYFSTARTIAAFFTEETTEASSLVLQLYVDILT